MCTAINMRNKFHYFGRNLDLEYHFNEEVVIMPQNFLFPYRNVNYICKHYPIIGMATVIDNIPLYYDATNIYGLSMAGLNFPGNAIYPASKDNYNNITTFEFIPWILQQCRSVSEARVILERTNITDENYSANMPVAALHWLISDSKESIVIETTAKGINIYKNPIEILTNNPPFPFHQYNLCNYLNLTNNAPNGDLTGLPTLEPYSNGMGGIGLPGDLSSASRFVRAAFFLKNSNCEETEASCVSQFFHILDTVAHPRGSVIVNDKYEITYYSSCCNATKGIYYYKTYDNSRITAIDMHAEPLASDRLLRYPLRTDPDIFFEKH